MYQRILVPVDGSETSNKALLAALDLARMKGGQVRIVHAIESPLQLTGAAYGASLRQVLHDEGADILQRALAIADIAEVSAETRLLDEPGRRLGEVVADAAREWPADLIVIGTHGRRGVARALLGSGAEHILRMAPVPVLAVRGADSGA